MSSTTMWTEKRSLDAEGWQIVHREYRAPGDVFPESPPVAAGYRRVACHHDLKKGIVHVLLVDRAEVAPAEADEPFIREPVP